MNRRTSNEEVGVRGGQSALAKMDGASVLSVGKESQADPAVHG